LIATTLAKGVIDSLRLFDQFDDIALGWQSGSQSLKRVDYASLAGSVLQNGLALGLGQEFFKQQALRDAASQFGRAGLGIATEVGRVLTFAEGLGAIAKSLSGISKSISYADDALRGVTLFGKDELKHYIGSDATLGGRGGKVWFMPAEDAARVKTVAQAAKESGYARSVKKAYLSGGDVYGIEFPVNKRSFRVPTLKDAGTPVYEHYLPGGKTAVRGPEGPNSFYMVNKTREFVMAGGKPVPKGAVLFKLGANGEKIIIKRWR